MKLTPEQIATPETQPAIKAAVSEADIWNLKSITAYFKYKPLPSTLVIKCRLGNSVINNPQVYVADIISVLKANPHNEEYRPYLEELRKIKSLLEFLKY